MGLVLEGLRGGYGVGCGKLSEMSEEAYKSEVIKSLFGKCSVEYLGTIEDVGRATVGQNLSEGRGGARPSVLEVVVEEEVYEIALWWECRPVIRRSSRQADGQCSSEVGGEESSRAEKRVTKGWVSVRLETCIPSGDGTGGQRAIGGKTHAPEPFVAWETEDLRKLNGVVRISETDKALEEESTMESFGHSGDWNEGVLVDNTMWLTVYEGCVERSNGCREVGAKESSSAMERGFLRSVPYCDTQTERGMQEDKWEESDLAKFSQFLGFPTEGLGRKY
ncbi:hypothetical protein CK203_085360 [Vitis vinifera]|uniref:DUF4283 domain-containing protein n=1 Tax=Vitis vinifera TaxID=29760 RepID=A0A438DCX8_VITVI|nr:hypothetical protein CK203_085360 [Vitis vinifera]